MDNSLNIACYNDKLKVVKYLLRKGADIHNHNEMPLSSAGSCWNFKIIKHLVKNGADIDWNNGYLISEFVKSNHLNFVKFLIDSGANININASSPLLDAITHNNLEMVKLLVENGAVIGFLHFWIASERDPELYSYILENSNITIGLKNLNKE